MDNEKETMPHKEEVAAKGADAPEKKKADAEDDFEYDSEGNIIIPEVNFDDEEEEEGDEEEALLEGEEEDDGDEDSGDTDGEDDEETEADEESTEEPEEKAEEENSEEEAAKTDEDAKKEDDDGAPDEKDKEIARLRAELEAFRSQAEDTLKALDAEASDPLRGLAKMAADAEGTPVDEYLAKRQSEERDNQARALLRQQEYEKIFRADISELHAAYPDTKQYDDIRALPEEILKKFASFRDRGLSAKEAYAAANPDGIRTNIATAVKKQTMHESKSHLHSSVPKGSKDNSIVMPESELKEWRELFPGKTDKEIRTLYKNTAK